MLSRKCKVCDSVIHRPLKYSDIQWTKRLFCSLKCSGLSHRNNCNYICKICGQFFVAPAWRKRQVCSKECKNFILGYTWKGKKFSQKHKKRLSISHTGKNNELSSNWKGGISKLPEYSGHFTNLRRFRKIKNAGFHSIIEWLELKKRYNYKCLGCKKQEPKIKLQRDHVIPVSKGGSNNINNIQPLCSSCNRKKHLSIIDYRQDNLKI